MHKSMYEYDPRDGDIYGHETIIWTDVAKYHEVTLHANIKILELLVYNEICFIVSPNKPI